MKKNAYGTGKEANGDVQVGSVKRWPKEALEWGKSAGERALDPESCSILNLTLLLTVPHVSSPSVSLPHPHAMMYVTVPFKCTVEPQFSNSAHSRGLFEKRFA